MVLTSSTRTIIVESVDKNDAGTYNIVVTGSTPDGYSNSTSYTLVVNAAITPGSTDNSKYSVTTNYAPAFYY